MNILIVSHYFPPLNEIASLRLYAFAKYLARDGYNVFVVTSEKSISDGDLTLFKNLPDNVIVKTVSYKSIATIYSNIKNRSNKDVKPSNSAANLLTKKSKLKSFLAETIYKLGSLLDFQYFWRNPATKVCNQIILQNKIDVVISSFSPISSFIIAARIKKRFNHLKWVADYRDLCSLNNSSAAKGIFNKIEQRIELKTVGKYSDLITVVSEPLKESLQALFPQKKILVVENGFDEDDYEQNISIERTVLSKKTKVIVHAGTIYPINRDPSPLFKALNQLYDEGKIGAKDFKIVFYGNKLGDLLQIIESCKAERWVEIGGQVSHTESLKIQSNSDLLLFLEGDNKKSKGVLTGKLFEYLMSQVPILGIGITEDTSSGKLILESEAGFVLGDNIEMIKKALLQVITDEEITYFRPDFKVINKYSRRLLTKKMLEGIEAL